MALETSPTKNGEKFAWCRLRLKNGVSIADKKELERGISELEDAEFIFAGIVVTGVGLEFLGAVLVAFFHFAATSRLEMASSLIGGAYVAFGIIGEVAAGIRIKLFQGELSARSNKELGEANERAANAERETARLRSEFGWRGLSPEKIKKLVDVLNKTPGKVMIMHPNGDSESASYAMKLVFAFRHSGWGVSVHSCTYPLLEFGVRAPELPDKAAAPSKVVRAALKEAEVEFDSLPIPAWTSTTGWQYATPYPSAAMRDTQLQFGYDPAQLYVGPKPMPWAKDGVDIRSTVNDANVAQW